MRAASPQRYRRGKRGTYYLRRRIPTEVLDAFPRGVREIVRSLRTRDPQVAERTLRTVRSRPGVRVLGPNRGKARIARRSPGVQ